MANQLKFLQGSYEQYNALAKKDPDALYFLSDTYQIYRGENIFAKSYEVVSSLPAVAAGKVGVLYVNTGDKTLYEFNGTSFSSVLAPAEVLTSVSQTDNIHAATSKAIYDFVIAKVAEAVGGSTSLIADVKASASNGAIAVLKTGEASEYQDVFVKGVVTNPLYEQATRTITLPIQGGEPLVINLGKDMVISSGSYNPLTEELELTIANTDPAQIIKIPVGELVDVYTSGSAETDTVGIVVTADNKIKGNIKIDATSKLFTDSTTGALSIDLSEYALAATVTALTTRVENAESDIEALQLADIQTLEDAKLYTDSINTSLITNIGTAKSEAIAQAKIYTDTVVGNALTWNPIV